MLSSGMEPDIKKYLAKLLNSMSIVLLWLLINAMLGIYLEWAFFDDGISLVNIIFYLWFLGSFIFVVYYLIKKWKF